jgi:hypothetical protein
MTLHLNILMELISLSYIRGDSPHLIGLKTSRIQPMKRILTKVPFTTRMVKNWIRLGKDFSKRPKV